MLIKKIIYSTIALGLSIFLSACGGSSSGDNNSDKSNQTNTKIGTRHYVDSPVEGVEYDCGNQSGITDSNGTFRFEEGKGCILSIASIVLKELNASLLENTMVIVEDNISNARLLQTLDNDGNASNGIEITKNVLKIISENNFTAVPVGDELGTLFQEIEGAEGYQGAMVSLEDAQRHVSETIKSLGLDELLNQIPTEGDTTTTEEAIDSLFEGLQNSK